MIVAMTEEDLTIKINDMMIVIAIDMRKGMVSTDMVEIMSIVIEKEGITERILEVVGRILVGFNPLTKEVVEEVSRKEITVTIGIHKQGLGLKKIITHQMIRQIIV